MINAEQYFENTYFSLFKCFLSRLNLENSGYLINFQIK